MEVNILLSALTALLNGAGVVWAYRIEKGNKLLSKTIHRAATHQRELAQLIDTHNQLADIQDKTETLIDSGTSTLRSIHHEIANIPFEILESLPATRDTTKVVKGVHDITSDTVYASISTLNKAVGRKLRDRLKLQENNKNNEPE